MFSGKIIQKIKQFNQNTSGNIAMMTAILGTALFTSAGLAIDYTRMINARSEMIQALDAAVLAVGTDLISGSSNTQSEFRETFENFFYANLVGRGRSEDDFNIVEFSADPATGEVKAVTRVEINASMMRIAGYDTLNATSQSSSIFSVGDVEVAMMLDVTGSMDEDDKIDDLKLAATDAVEILLPNDNTRGVRIGLVPYASSVNVGLNNARIVTGGTSNPCVTERSAQATTDASYRVASIASDSRTAEDDRLCPESTILPLTNRKNRLKNEISAFEAQGSTAGHLGVAWSYYMLSENWRDLWRTQNDPAPYSDDVKKIAILMTDGEFNTYYDGTIGTPWYNEEESRSYAEESNRLAIDLCEDMKSPKGGAPGITIYAIAFNAPSEAERTLRSCANPDTDESTFYYSADNGDELRDAFKAIAADISRLRISR